ncbi:epsilon tubulin [Chlorella sorokiniana]|uniref:Epsilon tubulin n=1 Tax=Chlorella sorokiniana TaxID=3076 RepID=A0A2P6TCB9_CHLSO|nr:epsilon tubulin [Chlorella sorokiniana]|eukprot:PRW20279.1 epsilon tubulin [Chlorella sorokiniana]
MEEGVVNSILRGPLAELFDSRQLLTDVSGAGNNWAVGNCMYGPQYRDSLSNVIRSQAEACDSLQGFMLLHSLGGGTGSGLGSYVLEQLADEYPEVERFSTCVLPSPESDDVVTSPFNACLSLAKLAEHADCVLPVDNQALADICAAAERSRVPRRGAAAAPAAGKGEQPFDAMNSIAANLLLHLTASVRFEGQLNLDLNEVTTNLVPYPRLHFLLASMTPLGAATTAAGAAAASRQAGARSIDQAFLDVLSPSQQLVKVQPKQHTYLACGLIARGSVSPWDLNRGIGRLRQQMRMAPWAEEAFKTGLCSCSPVGSTFSLLGLANNCGMAATLAGAQQRFLQLYRRRLYVHHYTAHLDAAELEAAAEAVGWLAESYRQLDDTTRPPDLARLRPQEFGASGAGQLALGDAPLRHREAAGAVPQAAMPRSSDGGEEDAAPEALFCAYCGTDIDTKKEEYIRVNCSIESCRQNYHADCMTEFLLGRAAQLESWRSREKYEVSAKKRPAMLLQQHWQCPCVYAAPGVKAEQPCNGFTSSGDLVKPAKTIVLPPPAAAGGPRAAAQKKQQLPSLRPTKKPVLKQLSGSTHFTAHVPTPGSGLGGSRGLLGDSLGVGAGAGAKTFAQEQEEARKAAEKKRRRKGSASGAAPASAATADAGAASGGNPAERSVSTLSPTPSAEALPVPLPVHDSARRAICISSLTDMGFSWRDAEAAADASGGELETALHLLTSGAVGRHPLV